jgi:hypothetical protein
MSPKPQIYTYISKDVKFNLLTTQSLKRYTTVNQLLKGKYKEQNYDFNLLTKFAPDEITTIALTKFGARIFTAKYNNKSIEFTPTPLLPQAGTIRPEYILADMQWIYWPMEEIQKNLSGGITISELPLKRVLTKGGKTIIEISYSKKDKWQSVIYYKNFERNYEYSIENL